MYSRFVGRFFVRETRESLRPVTIAPASFHERDVSAKFSTRLLSVDTKIEQGETEAEDCFYEFLAGRKSLISDE